MSRYYRLPDRRLVPSVSAVLDALAKPALQYWSAKRVAEDAYDMRDYWSDLDREPAIGWLKKAPYRSMKKAADRGRDVHLAIETGEWRDVEAFRPAYDAMTAEHGLPSFLAKEKVVWTNRYAGRLDCVADFDGRLLLVDWKTTGAVRPSTELQCGAYAVAWERRGFASLDGAVIVRLVDDGTFEWIEYDVDTLYNASGVFDSLLAVQAWQVRKGEITGASDIVDVTE